MTVKRTNAGSAHETPSMSQYDQSTPSSPRIVMLRLSDHVTYITAAPTRTAGIDPTNDALTSMRLRPPMIRRLPDDTGIRRRTGEGARRATDAPVRLQRRVTRRLA